MTERANDAINQFVLQHCGVPPEASTLDATRLMQKSAAFFALCDQLENDALFQTAWYADYSSSGIKAICGGLLVANIVVIIGCYAACFRYGKVPPRHRWKALTIPLASVGIFCAQTAARQLDHCRLNRQQALLEQQISDSGLESVMGGLAASVRTSQQSISNGWANHRELTLRSYFDKLVEAELRYDPIAAWCFACPRNEGPGCRDATVAYVKTCLWDLLREHRKAYLVDRLLEQTGETLSPELRDALRKVGPGRGIGGQISVLHRNILNALEQLDSADCRQILLGRIHTAALDVIPAIAHEEQSWTRLVDCLCDMIQEDEDILSGLPQFTIADLRLSFLCYGLSV